MIRETTSLIRSKDARSDYAKTLTPLKVYRQRSELFNEMWKWLEDEIKRVNILKGFIQRRKERTDGEIIALIHSEISECLEGLRHGNPPSEHIPEFSAAEEKLADAVIRIMDFAKARKFRVIPAFFAKLEFNRNRPYMHGKSF